MTPKLSSDARRVPCDGVDMDERAIRTAALITLHRAVLERFSGRFCFPTLRPQLYQTKVLRNCGSDGATRLAVRDAPARDVMSWPSFREKRNRESRESAKAVCALRTMRR